MTFVEKYKSWEYHVVRGIAGTVASAMVLVLMFVLSRTAPSPKSIDDFKIIRPLLWVVLPSSALFWAYAIWKVRLLRVCIAQNFKAMFEMDPPQKKDWVEMHVAQQVANEKLKEFEGRQNALRVAERVRLELPPENERRRTTVQELVAKGKENHEPVAHAQHEFEYAKQLAVFYSLSPAVPKAEG